MPALIPTFSPVEKENPNQRFGLYLRLNCFVSLQQSENVNGQNPRREGRGFG